MNGLTWQSDGVARKLLRKIKIIAKFKMSSGVIWLNVDMMMQSIFTNFNPSVIMALKGVK